MPSKITIGSGVFVPTDLSLGASIPVASSGEILRLEPPAGERVKLNVLISDGGGNNGISVKVGGVDILSSSSLVGNSSISGLSSFCVGVQSVDGTQDPREVSAAHPSITFGVDEIVTVEASTATTTVIYYNYEYGVLK